MPRTWDPNAPAPEEALHRLIEGNHRFRRKAVAPGWSAQARSSYTEVAAEPQRPFAIVLGCSDARTPVEILFDQGLGDLFVVRVAGHVVAPSVVGSIEFAAAQFGTRLVVVLGHTQCGAISATVHAIETRNGPESKNIRSITDRIAPNIEGLVLGASGANADHAAILRDATRANVRAAANHLRHGSQLLEELVLAGRVAVVGAEYDLDTGAVNFFDGVPGRPSTAPAPR
jgi:carbonic anhydrase